MEKRKKKPKRKKNWTCRVFMPAGQLCNFPHIFFLLQACVSWPSLKYISHLLLNFSFFRFCIGNPISISISIGWLCNVSDHNGSRDIFWQKSKKTLYFFEICVRCLVLPSEQRIILNMFAVCTNVTWKEIHLPIYVLCICMITNTLSCTQKGKISSIVISNIGKTVINSVILSLPKWNDKSPYKNKRKRKNLRMMTKSNISYLTLYMYLHYRFTIYK